MHRGTGKMAEAWQAGLCHQIQKLGIKLMGDRRGIEEQGTVLHCRRNRDIDDNQG